MAIMAEQDPIPTDLIKRYEEITAEKQAEIRSRKQETASMRTPSRDQIREEEISQIFRKRAREDCSDLD